MKTLPIVLALVAGPALADAGAKPPVPTSFQPVCIPCTMPCTPESSCKPAAPAPKPVAVAAPAPAPAPAPAKAAEAPVLSPAPGNFQAAQQVAIESPTAGAVIHYTTDGSEPTESSPVYSGPFAVEKTTTVRAIAVKAGAPASPVAGGAYDIVPPPAPTPARVVVTKEKLELKDKVFFDTGKATIQPVSYSLLDEVASVLKSHEEVKKLRIEGHTDSTGNAAYNRNLSQQRADAVRTYLEQKGVAAARLDTKGYGPDRPIESNKTAKGREANRRVEFRIEQ